MVMDFKANFQIYWTNRQGKNTVRGTRCPWVNSIMSGRSPPLLTTLTLKLLVLSVRQRLFFLLLDSPVLVAVFYMGQPP